VPRETEIILRYGTRALLDAAAAANGLLKAEPFLIDDEGRIGVALSASTYQSFAKQAEALGGAGFTDLTATAPAAPGAGVVRLFLQNLAGKLLPAFLGPTGPSTTVQPHLTRNKSARWNPAGNAATTPPVEGLSALTVLGTATARTVATTNRFSRMRRMGYLSATSVGSFAGHYQAVAQFTIGNGAGEGGFHFVERMGCSDAAAVATARQFVGLSNLIAAPTNVEPASLTNCIGVGHGAADTNLKVYTGGSAANAPIDLGANFPANTLSIDPYEVSLFAAAETQTAGYRVENLRTGNVAEGTIPNPTPGTTLPLNSTLLAYRAWRTNNLTSLAVGIDVTALNLDTNF
jgi:hypothetical protein